MGISLSVVQNGLVVVEREMFWSCSIGGGRGSGSVAGCAVEAMLRTRHAW